jgi:NDP-sugar pyrophosphorylase family protein
MKAMILAAGLGTRLKPLTDERPKALVEVGGRSLLEITLARLRTFGVFDVIINIHHFADMISEYLQTHGNFGMRIVLSREDVLLDTGGGLKKAAHFFLDDAKSREEPFILHNVDVISTIDLRLMTQFHTECQALATLAVKDRESDRYLLFDERLQLCGRRSGASAINEMVRPSKQVQALAFSGIHIISPRMLAMMTEEGTFSIIASYLRLAAQGQEIIAFRSNEYYWRDLGKTADLRQAALDLNAFATEPGLRRIGVEDLSSNPTAAEDALGKTAMPAKSGCLGE